MYNIKIGIMNNIKVILNIYLYIFSFMLKRLQINIYSHQNFIDLFSGMDVFTVDSASRVPPPPYLPPSATSTSASSAPPRSNTSLAPPTSNGLPPWSITNHSTVNGGVHSNGNAAQPKIYDPNDDEDEDDWIISELDLKYKYNSYNLSAHHV